MATLLRHLWIGCRAVLVLTVVLGILYPMAMYGVGTIINRDGTTGSVVEVDGVPVASTLIAQNTDDPRYFHPRPSAAGDGYDSSASGGSNLGPSSDELLALIEQRRHTVATEEGVDPVDVPPDALTASASGLDPHISPAYADIQVARVAEQNGLSEDEVRSLVNEHTSGGTISPELVNVVSLNIALSVTVGT